MSGRPPVRLRGHHLICLQFFAGEGYSAEYVENMRHVVEYATREPALVVDTVDNVCAACPVLGPDNQCESEDGGGEEEIVRIDALALRVLDAHVGEHVTLSDARERLEADAFGVGVWRAEACHGCTWEHVCEPGWNALLKSAETEARSRES